MLAHLLLATAAAAALPLQGDRTTDTTFAVPAGARLSLTNVAGEVVIRGWDRSQVRVQAAHSSRETVSIELSGSVLRLTPRTTRGIGGFGRIVDYQLTVPAAMAVEIQGMYADVAIEGTRGDVKVTTVEGNLTVRGGDGTIALTTINGKIEVRGGKGRMELRSTSEDIEATDVEGDVLAETVSGDISLRGINARRVEAQTVSGDVEFQGTIRNDGAYTLLTHSGDITIALPDGANASVRAAVGSGDIEASFALPTGERMTRRRQLFRLGTGSATIELETFSGDIRMVRPTEIRRRDKED
jgi:DUF4097 and DUF4098 domain-containing protein YvlB